jgi:signal transduction histidine kinase
MMRFRSSFPPQTIAAQITGLLVVSILLGVGLASTVLLYLFNQGQNEVSREVFAAGRAAHIATIVREAHAARSPEQLSDLLTHLRLDRMEVGPVPLGGLKPKDQIGEAPEPRAIAAVENDLREDWKLEPLESRSPSPRSEEIILAINGRDALRFDISPHGGLHNLLFVEAIAALSVITLSILLLSAYAVRWIVSPLSSIASAAQSFGRSDGDEEELHVGGPQEIREAARALNDMRKRVRILVRERTLMLTAISHDLRTPLTRIRLRAERLSDEATRAAVLSDVVTISDMLGETLAYIRGGSQREQVSLFDLPSLLETIAAQFSDVGHEVSYRGSGRFTVAGRMQSIGRAVTNIVENATKFGSRTEIVLRELEEGAVEIEIIDDGPGVPASLLDRVFEPFFKGDSARPNEGRGGFGLGLSIARDIVERHGGAITLRNRDPHGLSVRMTLKPQPTPAMISLTSAETAEKREYADF